MAVDVRFLRQLRIVSLIEGISTLFLFFVAMPLKYLAGMPLAVTIAGTLHGGLFLWAAGMFVMATHRVPISRQLAGFGVLAAVLPLGPFVVDRWLARAGSSSRKGEHRGESHDSSPKD